MDLQPGDVFAGCRIEGIAGRGGMGVVYRATQLALDRVVALKTIAPDLAADPAFRGRFVRESKAAAAIEHPNVIPIFSAGEDGGVLYIVMRHVDGPDLRTVIRAEGRLPVERAGGIVAQVAAALDVAHARGLVHRDVKPANVLLAGGDHAYLTDFGLTKRVHTEASAVTRAGGWVGTLGYVAPEQIRDERIDGRTDTYALGCVLFSALAGAPPFERSTDEATLWAHLHAEPEIPDGTPPAVAAALQRALAKDPADRFASAGDFGRAILAALDLPASTVAGLAGERRDAEETRVTPPEAAPTAVAAERPARRRRSPLLAALAAIALAGLAAALLVAVAANDPKLQSEEPDVESVEVGRRPNGLAVARGSAYLTTPRGSRLTKVDLETFRVAPGPPIPRGALDVDAGLGALWVTSAAQERFLTRIDLATGRRRATPLPEGTPVGVVTGTDAVWVGLRGAERAAFPPARLLRIDPATGEIVRSTVIGRGIHDLTATAGHVWITNRDDDTVLRIDAKTGERRIARVGRDPSGIAIGGGAVWVANTGDSTVSRISRDDLRDVATIAVDGQPRGLAYGERRVWVTSFATSTLTAIDGRTGRPTGTKVELSLNPTKVLVTGGAVYAVAQAGGRLDRYATR